MRPTANKSTPRLSISIVGSGRLGTALAIALATAGYSIPAVVARRRDRAKRAATLIGPATSALTANHLNLLPPVEVILISTPDDKIAETAQRLAISLKSQRRGRIVLHTSGALSSAVLRPLGRIGFKVGSLHPLISVSDPHTGAESLRGAFYGIEGDKAAVRVARAMVRDLNGQSFSIASSSKALYHAAAVMASGHVVALFDIATEMLVRCGLRPGKARRVLLPLLESTVRNLSKSEPARALTGTFARGDFATVQRHLKSLSTERLEDAVEAYKILGTRSLKLGARIVGIDPHHLSLIRQALVGQAGKK